MEWPEEHSFAAGSASAGYEPEPDGESVVATDWREDYAFNMGVAGMHYFYPYLRMAMVRWDWTQEPSPYPEVVPNLALNRFWHGSRLTDASWREGGAPNNDTLYSIAWLHVADEPMVLSIPEIGRYFTFQLSGMNSDNFGYVSELVHGRGGGHYALLPRGWQGELPGDVTSLVEVPSPWVLVVGRTYVANEADVPEVRALQQQYELVPLSQWGREQINIPSPKVFKPYDPKADPLAVWKTINRALTENPPVDDEVALTAFFRELNLGPGMDVEALDEEYKRGLARAAAEGLHQIHAAQMSGAGRTVLSSNGWLYNLALGRAGTNGDFLNRTVHQSYAGIVAVDPVEAMYYGAFHGSDGQPLDGSRRYRIHMPAGSEPDVRAFWSITLYGEDGNLVANEIQRYSIGDRTEGLVRDAEGGLTIALQHGRPEDPDANWLPAPQGAFWLVLRAYQPGPDLLEGRWSLPPLQLEE
jgi:hypothetical protein